MSSPSMRSSDDNAISIMDAFAVAEVKLEQLLSKVDALESAVFSSASAMVVELRTILENLVEGALIVDASGFIRSPNSAFCTLVGQQEADVIGHSHWEILGPAASIAALSVLDAGRYGRIRSRCKAVITGSSGNRVPVHITAAALRDEAGESLGSIFFLYDMTRQQELEEANARLKASSHLKDLLLQMIVHDLRTPLTSLMTGVETVPFVSDLSDDGKKCLEIAMRGGRNLLSMISDLLDVSKFEEGAMQLGFGPIQVSALVERAYDQVMELARAKKLVFEQNIPYDLPTICGDEEKVLRTLVNLIGNAFRFTPEGGIVSISARILDDDSATRTKGAIVFSVTDTGAGVSPEALPHIFEKFYSVIPRSGKGKLGSGLGLTFCKMAVEAHGGQIWVESETGRGSTFSFSIPTGLPGKANAG